MSVWCIGGSDPSQGAGVLADKTVLDAMGVRNYTIITAVTAQNGHEVSAVSNVCPSMVEAQWKALANINEPKVIKMSLVPSVEIMECLACLLKSTKATVIFDPVMLASTGKELLCDEVISKIPEILFPYIDVLLPNRVEAQKLTGKTLSLDNMMSEVAKSLQQLGARNVLLKGGHLFGEYAFDVWLGEHKKAWIALPRLRLPPTHGTGCVLGASLAGYISKGYSLFDAVLQSKHALYTRLLNGEKKQTQVLFPSAEKNTLTMPFPWWGNKLESVFQKMRFPKLKTQIGFYPIVNDLADLQCLLSAGVKSIQLRIKEHRDDLESIIATAIKWGKMYQAQLFINDYWQLAIKYRAFGVHLGYEDVQTCDIQALAGSGLTLGLSTHSYEELGFALSFQPSYIALGPIFTTTTKKMRFPPQGIQTLNIWRDLVPCQLVAIGGIDTSNIQSVLDCGVDGVSIVSAIQQSNMPIAIRQFQRYFDDHASAL